MFAGSDAFFDFVEEIEREDREERIRQPTFDLDALIDSPRLFTEAKATASHAPGEIPRGVRQQLDLDFFRDSPRSFTDAKATTSQAPGEIPSGLRQQLDLDIFRGSPRSFTEVQTPAGNGPSETIGGARNPPDTFADSLGAITEVEVKSIEAEGHEDNPNSFRQQLDGFIDFPMIAEAKAISGSAQDDGSNSARAVSALLALIRKEVRAAVEQEFTALRTSLPTTPLAHEGDGAWAQSSELKDLSTCTFSGAGSGATSPHSMMAATKAEQSFSNGNANLAPVSITDAPNSAAVYLVTEELCRQSEYWERAWKHEAELRAEGDQEVESRILARLEPQFGQLEARMEQIEGSVKSLAKLQMDFGEEAKLRQDVDGRLQTFLRDFRHHIVGEIEDVWAKHQQLCAAVEGMRELMGQIVSMVQQTGVALSLPSKVSPVVAVRQPPSMRAPTLEVSGASTNTACSNSISVATATTVAAASTTTAFSTPAWERPPSPTPPRSPHVSGPDELEVTMKVPGDSPSMIRRSPAS